jgi:hypothetical protein
MISTESILLIKRMKEIQWKSQQMVILLFLVLCCVE